MNAQKTMIVDKMSNAAPVANVEVESAYTKSKYKYTTQNIFINIFMINLLSIIHSCFVL